MSKRAIVLAGGRGQRLRPYTVVLPKPLMPIGEFSILEVIIRQLVSNDFSHITLSVNHMAEIIQAFLRDGSKWKIKIDYSVEEKPLSTMGPLKLIPDLPDNFLIMNGDVLTDLNYGDFYDYHVYNHNIFTISSYKREVNIDFGVLDIDESSKLRGFQEKPTISYEVSMGIYMVNKQVLDIIPENIPYGFDNLMLDLIRKNMPVSTKRHDGYWLDIGRPDDYIQAINDFDAFKDRLLK